MRSGIESDVESLRPGLAVRVGVTGHRELPAANENLLLERIRSVLGLVQRVSHTVVENPAAGYSRDTPTLRAISPLAEGADRLFARAAVELGWELQCPLPFEREEYRKDFRGAPSLKSFDAFLGHPSTTAVMELDGRRAEESVAYQAVGRLMLEQSDILVAVWDGERPMGRGGTAQIIDEATRQEIPLIWVDATPPHAARLLLCMENKPGCVVEPEELEGRLSEALTEILVHRGVRDRATAHAVLEMDEDPDPLGDYSARGFVSGSILGWIWGAFARIWSIGVKMREAPPLPDGPYRHQYNRADAAAQHFSGLYRGSFLTNYLLGVCAVLSALLAYAHHSWHTLWVLAELVAIVSILAVITTAKVRRWHERAIDCRYLAEQLRQMLFLHPLGRVAPSSRPPVHYAFGDPRSTWMNWRFRALVRQIGMPGPAVRLDARANEESFAHIRHRWIPSQVHYHRDNAERLHTIDHRLHLTANVLFYATIGSCLSHFFVHDPVIVPWLTFFSAGLPACGAALHAISSHGEFRRLAERSGAMADQLKVTIEELDAIARDTRGIRSTALGHLTSEAAQTMIDEVSDWRIIYRKPPLEPA